MTLAGHLAWHFHHLPGALGLTVASYHRTSETDALRPRQTTPFPFPCPFEAIRRSRRIVSDLAAVEQSLLSGTRGLDGRAGSEASRSYRRCPAPSTLGGPRPGSPQQEGSTLWALQSGKVSGEKAIPRAWGRGPMSWQRRAWVQLLPLAPSKCPPASTVASTPDSLRGLWLHSQPPSQGRSLGVGTLGVTLSVT